MPLRFNNQVTTGGAPPPATDAERAVAHFLRASQLHDEGRWPAALDGYERAIACKPDFAEAYTNRGIVLQMLGRLDAALESYDAAIAIMPAEANAHSCRSVVLQALQCWDAALESCDRALALQPEHAGTHVNRGNVLKHLGQLEAALAAYDRALKIAPDYADALVNRGNVQRELGDLAEAQRCFDRAIDIRPEFAEAYFCRALARLLGGDLEQGWRDYEWRWKDPNGPCIRELRSFPRPLWRGTESLHGKTILLHAEQGLGDTLQFCRYARLVAERGATVLLEVHGPLVDLLGRLDGVSRVIEKGAPWPPFDYHCPLMSLPLAFETQLSTIPWFGPYLHPDPRKVSVWRHQLAAKSPRIGLAWSGSPVNPNDRQRSIALQTLLAHLPAGFHFYSLNKELRDADRRTLAAAACIEDLAAGFSDTAAICETMDLVISVDTSIAHLSAALGRPTWILLPFNPDWRWLLERVDNPWYPTARLYRQRYAEDWQRVLQQVNADLRAFAAARAGNQ